MKRTIILVIACLFLFGFKPLMPDEWQAVCRHKAVYHAYTVSNYGYTARIAIGWKWVNSVVGWEAHARAQVFNLKTGEWNWLCDENGKVFICYAEDRRTFRVTHYISLESAIKGKWNLDINTRPGEREIG